MSADVRTIRDARELPMWVVYSNPLDYPGKFVTRLLVSRGESVLADPKAAVFETLEEARTHVPQGFVNIGRSPFDDPAIHEVWV